MSRLRRILLPEKLVCYITCFHYARGHLHQVSLISSIFFIQVWLLCPQTIITVSKCGTLDFLKEAHKPWLKPKWLCPLQITSISDCFLAVPLRCGGKSLVNTPRSWWTASLSATAHEIFRASPSSIFLWEPRRSPPNVRAINPVVTAMNQLAPP